MKTETLKDLLTPPSTGALRWTPGPMSAHPQYELQEVLCVNSDVNQCAALLECFASNPDIFYANAVTIAGDDVRRGPGYDYVQARDWCERMSGAKPNRPIMPSRLDVGRRP